MKKLTLRSFLTVGLTEHLALGPTSIFITLKFFLYNAMGGRERWAIAASHNVMLVTHGTMLAHSSFIPDSSSLEPQLCQQGRDKGYTLSSCMNKAFGQSLQVRCGKKHFDYGPPFWIEPKNTGNLKYSCHAFTASLVKKNIFVIISVHQKQKSDSNSSSWEPDS